MHCTDVTIVHVATRACLSGVLRAEAWLLAMSNVHLGALKLHDGAVLRTEYRAYVHTGFCTRHCLAEQVDKFSTTQHRLDSFNVLRPFPRW
jgi:hypothetical protein